MSEEHQFDRRISDANVASLAVRVTGLERRVETVEHQVGVMNMELVANTALTKQAHEKAETIKTDTETIIEATKWMSTSKKLLVSASIVVGSATGAATGVIALVKALT